MERPNRVAVGHVGGEDREALARDRRVDREERGRDDRHRVVDPGHGPHPIGDGLGKRPRAADLQRRLAGQVLHGVGERAEDAPVDDADGDDHEYNWIHGSSSLLILATAFV